MEDITIIFAIQFQQRHISTSAMFNFFFESRINSEIDNKCAWKSFLFYSNESIKSYTG